MSETEVIETEYPCPKDCGNNLVYGNYNDARRGTRGYSCEECGYIWSTWSLKSLGIIEEENDG